MTDINAKFSDGISHLALKDTILGAERIIVAFSGGADSSLLLRLMKNYLDKTGIILECAHLNHMIRGDEADRDEEFCLREADALGIKCHVCRRDIPSLADGAGGIEEVARRERYSFFEELCKASSARTLIATAHNADDNLETILFNMMRGSGLRGMCGIPPYRDGRYIRPILTFTGSEIREYCRTLGISYVYDSTNGEEDYTRNRIRRRIVPELVELSPSIQSAALRMSINLRSDSEYMDSVAADFKLDAHGAANVEEIEALHPSILSRVLCRMWCTAAGTSVCSLEAVHIRTIAELLSRRGQFDVCTPHNLTFVSNGKTARFTLPRSETPVIPDTSEYTLTTDGKAVKFNAFSVHALCSDESLENTREYSGNIYNLSINKSVSFDKIKGKLILRARKPGDAYRFGGMTHRVKKLMSEKGIPLEERNCIPVIADDNGIVWIPGFPLRDGLKPSLGDQCLNIYISRDGKLL